MQSGRCNPGDAITCVSPPRQKRERCLDAYLMRVAIICNQKSSSDCIRVHHRGSSEVIGGAREPSPSAVDGLSLHWPAPRHLWGEGRVERRGEHLHARSRSTGQPRGTEYAAAESASMRFVKYEKGANEKSGIMRSRCSLETRALESRGTRPHLWGEPSAVVSTCMQAATWTALESRGTGPHLCDKRGGN